MLQAELKTAILIGHARWATYEFTKVYLQIQECVAEKYVIMFSKHLLVSNSDTNYKNSG